MRQIVTATKYADVRRAVRDRPLAKAATAHPRRTESLAPSAGGLHIFVPKPGVFVGMDEWFWRELREGGYLNHYLRRERSRHKDNVRKVAKRYVDYKPNPKSDWELLAAVPARLYHRWAKEDRDFWRDDSNLRSLKRDNPELPIFV